MNLTGARFKIRSVKEREEELEKVTRSLSVNKDESSRLNPYSAPFSDSDGNSNMRPRALSKFSVSKTLESSSVPKTSPTVQVNKDSFERGRTEWRPGYSRSKSLDGRGARQLQTVVLRNTADLNQSNVSRSEDQGLSNSPCLNKLVSPSKRLPSQVKIAKEAELSILSEMIPIDHTHSDTVTSPLFTERGRTKWRQTSASTRSKSVEWKGTKNEAQKETQNDINQDATDLNGGHSEISEKLKPSSPISNELTKSTNRLPLQDSVTKQAELSSEVEKNRGRTEWRQGNTSNRSKSLDWRGRRNDGNRQTQSVVITNTIDFGENSKVRSKDLQKEESTCLNTNDLASPRNRKPLQIYTGIPEKWDSNGFISSVASGTSRVEMAKVFLAQASGVQTLPSKRKQNHDNTDEIKNSWWHSGPLSDKKEHNLSSQFCGSDVKKTAGGDNTDARSKVLHRDSIYAKNIVAPNVGSLSSSATNNSDLKLNKYTKDSWVGRSSSSISDVRNSSYSSKKGGTFPRTFSKELGNRLNSSSDVSPSSDTLSPVSPKSYERLFGKDSIFLQTGNSKYDVTKTEGPIGLGTSKKYGAEAISRTESLKSTYGSFDNKLERPKNKTTIHVSQAKDIETTQIKQIHSPLEDLSAQTKPQFSSMTTNSEIQKRLEFDVSNSLGKRDDLRKTFVPSLDSVKDKIHKFEALFQQSQSPSHNLHPKRALSVIETPKTVSGVSKSFSDRYLSLPRGNQEWGFLKETHFLCSDGSSPDSSDPPQMSIDKERETLQTPSSSANNLEIGVAHTLKLDDEISTGHQNKGDMRKEIKTSMINKHMDEPDQVSHLIQNVKSMETNKIRHYLNDAIVETADRKSNDNTDGSRYNPKNTSSLNCPLKVDIKTQSSTKLKQDKAFQATKSTTVFPKETISSSVKSKSAFNPFSDSSTSGDINNVFNTIANKKAAAKVSRWIMGEGDGLKTEDEEDEEGTEKGDDSDSGDSSITITSNTSNVDHKSFSVSFVELCSLGGLEDLPSVGNGLKDEENWINRKTSSMSSDVSAFSCVSLLGAEELDSLLEDVRGLGDDALQNYEDIQVVVLHKEVGIGLGFTVAGGLDQNKHVTVHRVLPYGVAAQEGSIHEGDHVLSINGTAFHSSTHKEALHTLRRARKRSMAVVVIRRGVIADVQHVTEDGLHTASGKTAAGSIRVTLMKSSSDLGFSLKGGVGSNLGDEPITVQRLFQGGPVGQVFPGDELLEVEGQSLRGLRRLEAWNLIKRLPSGPVEVVLQRSHQYQTH